MNQMGNNFCTTNAALAVTAGSNSTYATTNTLLFCVNGKWGTALTAVTGGTTPTTDYVTGKVFKTMLGGGNTTPATAGQGSVFVWVINAAGTVKVIQGEVTALDTAGNFITAPEFPMIPSDVTPFAYQVCKAGATADATTGIVFGAGNWNATGYTNAIVNCAVLPDRPQIS